MEIQERYNCCCLFRFKVHLQTQQKEKVTLLQMGIRVVKSDGILGLYNGLSASILRQVCFHLLVAAYSSKSASFYFGRFTS